MVIYCIKNRKGSIDVRIPLSKTANQKYLTLPEQFKLTETMVTKLAKTKTGITVESFSYSDVNGKNVAPKDLKGKVVLIDLLATWCGPCLAQEPHWKKIYEEYKDKGVAFVGISIDKNNSK
ncbi:TlpA family protein disulfide reductase [Sphingobacterium sp. 1.A.4]|uniref:TlpA family protein disulfide reductase n=1 Tax=Sphingobacterium sp. 1.A.4 TaxID=2044603 RepID=UPI000C0C0399|nr:TlpA disulfide reductase family protein [Sphingobacterium sp. 1.A.4]